MIQYWTDDIERMAHTVTVNAAKTDGFIMKCGTSAAKVTVAAAGNFFQNYLESTVTSGTVCGIYNRLYLSGTGTTSGESLRSFTTVNNVAVATAHGAHISLNFGTTGSITGLGVGVRATLHVPNQEQSFGTYAGAQSEVYFDGTSSGLSGATAASIHRFVVDGVSGYTNDMAYVFEFVGLNTTQWETTFSDTPDRGLKIRVNGTAYWIACCQATS